LWIIEGLTRGSKQKAKGKKKRAGSEPLESNGETLVRDPRRQLINQKHSTTCPGIGNHTKENSRKKKKDHKKK